MKNEEFNFTEIKNEKDGFSVEFGNFQDTEFYSFADNKTSIKDEVNDNDCDNDSKNNSTNKNNNDSLKNNNTLNHVSGGTATSGVLGAVSMVTVATLSTLIGINIFISAKYFFHSLEVFSNSLSYVLEMSDTKNDMYIISLENEELGYSYQFELFEGENEGFFEELESSTDYILSIKNVSLDDYILHQEVITTEDIIDEYDVSVIMEPIAYFDLGCFFITLEYDDSAGELNDFILHLLDSNGNEKSYSLENGLDRQTIYINNEYDDFLFEINDENGFEYYVSYMKNDREQASQRSHIIFETEEQEVASKLEFEINEIANFSDGYFYITLIHSDINKLSEIYLYAVDTNGYIKNYQLENTTDTQTIYINSENDDFVFDISDQNGFDFYIQYEESGEGRQTDTVNVIFSSDGTEDLSSVKATVSSKAYFSAGQFFVYLEYDDTNETLSNFSLYMIDSSENIKVYTLEKTLDIQTITINVEGDATTFDVSDENGFTFILSYSDNGEEKTYDIGKVVFEADENELSESSSV
ncbi:MAG: hypothetical protein K6G38_05285 [Gammaproteobacteria bacterium]|nr:hypothetical protein [Gammaproteobacteria bacterium]